MTLQYSGLYWILNNFHISLKVSISGEQLKIRKYLTVNNYLQDSSSYPSEGLPSGKGKAPTNWRPTTNRHWVSLLPKTDQWDLGAFFCERKPRKKAALGEGNFALWDHVSYPGGGKTGPSPGASKTSTQEVTAIISSDHLVKLYPNSRWWGQESICCHMIDRVLGG